MAYYLNDDPYRTSAKTYGITQLNSGLNPIVYTPDPTTKLAKMCGLLGKTTKVKEEDKPRVPEPTNYKKLAKYVVVHSIVLIIINLLTRYFICNTEEQKTGAAWLFSFLIFMIYSMMVLLTMYARSGREPSLSCFIVQDGKRNQTRTKGDTDRGEVGKAA